MPRQFGKRDESIGWPTCDRCSHRHRPDSACPVNRTGVRWLKRPMPDGQWPVDQRLPRDDSFNWWVRSACGHPGGVKQWAFYEERYADMYEAVFREDPCRWTRCPNRIMIENNGRSR